MANNAKGSSGGTDKKVTFKLGLDTTSFSSSFSSIMSSTKSQANKTASNVANNTKKSTSKIKSNVTNVASAIVKKAKTASSTITTKVVSACRTINTKVQSLRTKITSTVTRMMSTITSKIKTSLLVISALIVTQLYKAVEEASNLTEVQNVVDTAFKDMSDQVEAFASTATESFGLSELSAKQYAGQLKSISNAMGIANEEGTEMSLTLTGLSGDLASFYNTSSDEAFTALKGVYTGETEALKKYGIAMTTANLEAYALSQGITKSYESMSQAEKITLRYNYILSVTTDQQGDFAKTSDSYSNQLRILKQNWTQLLSVLGNGLVQILTPLLKTLNNMVTKLTALANTISNVLVEVFGFEKQTNSSGGSTLTDTYDDISTAADNATTSIENATEAAEEGLAAFDKINTVGSDSSSSSSSSSSSNGSGSNSGLSLSSSPYNLSGTSDKEVSIDVDVNYDKVKNFFSWWKDRITNTKKSFKDAFSNVDFTHLKESWNGFKDEAGKTWDWLIEKAAQFSAYFSAEVLPNLLDIATWALPKIRAGIDEAIEWLKERYENAKTSISDAFANIDWTPLSNAWSDFKVTAGDTVDWLIEKAAKLAAWFASEILPILLQIATEALPLIMDIIDAIDWEWIGDFIKYLLTWILEKLQGIRQWAEENPEKFKKIVNLVAKILAFVTLILPIFIKVGTAAWTIGSAMGSVASIISGPVLAAILLVVAAIALWIINWDDIKQLAIYLWEDLTELFSDIAEKIKTLFSNIKQWFVDLGENIKKGVTAVKDWFKERLSDAANLVSGFKDKVVGFFQNIGDKAKSIFEGVGSAIKGVLNVGIRACNTLISGINKFNIDVPSWVPVIGGSKWGFNIPKIPELANGGVINQPTVAMLGEYTGARHDPEIASKESELKSIFSDTLDEFTNRIVAALQGSNNQPQEINLQIHGKNLMSWIRDENQRESYRRGTPQLS